VKEMDRGEFNKKDKIQKGKGLWLLIRYSHTVYQTAFDIQLWFIQRF